FRCTERVRDGQERLSRFRIRGQHRGVYRSSSSQAAILTCRMPTILVVDDEPSIRRTLREILEYEGFTVEEAVDGDEALEKMAANHYDVVMLDVKMPKRDGMEVLEVARDEMPEVPIIMISGHGTIETAVEATKLGAFDFLEKPPDLNRLLVTVRNALDRGELRSEEHTSELQSRENLVC